jgi:predicted nucleic acid-binding protein
VIARVLLDTGPLVAILNAADDRHKDCVDQLDRLKPPLLTCWPVLVEAAWLLRDSPSALQNLLLSFNTGLLKLVPLDDSAMPWIAAFLRRYRKLDPQIADAALIHIAERDGLDTIFTLDRRDFSIYRMSGGRSLGIIP